jgi:hypothetical protein
MTHGFSPLFYRDDALTYSTGLYVINLTGKSVLGRIAEIAAINPRIRHLKPERLALGIFGHLVFSFF